MKNSVSKSLIFLVGAFAVISCSDNLNKEKEVEFTPEQQNLISHFSTIGEAHNEIMSLVYDELAKKVITKSVNDEFKVSKDNVIEIIRTTSNQIISAKSGFSESNVDPFFVVNINNETRSENNVLSNSLKELVDVLITISDDYTLSIEKHTIEVDKLNKRAFVELNQNDLEVFLMASSVACASFEYWHSNIEDWYEMLTGEDFQGIVTRTSPYDHPLLDGMTGADIGGAVAGAFGGAFFGGVGAAPGAIVGSSGASLGKFAENCWNYFF